MTHVTPLVPPPAPAEAFQKFADLPNCAFLDSALRRSGLGRYSFLTADPVAVLRLPRQTETPFDCLRDFFGDWHREVGLQPEPNLPPFQGGMIGLLSYELNQSIESIQDHRYRDFTTPAVHAGIYDIVIAWDHQTEQAWLISTGYPETQSVSRQARAQQRAETWLSKLQLPPMKSFAAADKLDSVSPSPCVPTEFHPDLMTNMTPDDYETMIRRGIEYIRAGDVFQVNLAQRLLFPKRASSVDLYRRLRTRNPATFGGYYDLGDLQLLSASPERLASLNNRRVETRPIKGTSPFLHRPEADLLSAELLRQSEKDTAENVMIVDLLRNDMSRVCRPDSISVDQLCAVESYQFVQHLVSVIRGELREELDLFHLLHALFPGGSITGAPKVRAMEIIAELEPSARGFYCGSLGYRSFTGHADWNILIRTITATDGWLQFQAGGGIVNDSLPSQEYEETWCKARGLLHAVLDDTPDRIGHEGDPADR